MVAIAEKKVRGDKKAITILLPPKLDLNDLNLVLTGGRGNSIIQKGVCFLYSYLIKKGFNSHKEGASFGVEYCQVDHEVLTTLLGRQYVVWVGLLMRTGYLERLNHDADGVEVAGGYYRSPASRLGGLAKQYRIPASLLDEEKNYRVAKELIGTADQNKLAAVSRPICKGVEDPYREHVRKMMQEIVLLNTPASRYIIDQLWAEARVQVTPDTYFDIFNKMPQLTQTTIDPFGKRVHSQVVNTSRRLRPSMRFADDLESELTEIDITNSQPAILASITPALIKRFAPECSSAIPLFKAVEREANYQLFQQLCFSGQIYEALQAGFNEAYGDKLMQPITRDEAKVIFYIAAFSDYNYLDDLNLDWLELQLNKAILYGSEEELDKAKEALHSVRAYQLFKTRFPAMHQLFWQLKELNWAFNPGKPHSNNCLLAQRIESALVFEVLVKALIEAGITKVVTIHDALFLRVQDEPKARKIVQLEFRKLKLQLKLKSK